MLWTTRTIRRCVMLAICVAVLAPGQSVETKSGNIFFTSRRGDIRQLTFSGMDSDPRLSINENKVIFVRKTTIPAGFVEPTDMHPTRTQICIVSSSGNDNPRVIYDGIIIIGKTRYTTFYEPALTVDERGVYLLIHYSVVEFGLVKLDLARGHARMISRALDWHFVISGNYAGCLVVQKRKTYPDGISTLFWLLSPDGKEIGYVGQSEAEAQEFLKNPKREIRPSPRSVIK